MWAGWVKGTVIDRQPREPLTGATVRVVGREGGAVADVDGAYALQLPAESGGTLSLGAGLNDRTQCSFSHTFFLSEATNRVLTEDELGLTDPKGVGQNYCPAAMLADGEGGYVGAFRDATDNWLEGWTNFDPQNTVY